MKSFKYSILVAVFFLTFSSCFDNYDELVPDLEGVPAGGVQSVQIMNVSGNTLQLEVTVFAVDHFGGFIEGLTAENFTVSPENTNYNYRLLSVTEEDDEFVGAYSAGLLFDQSGSINSTDPTNDRIIAGASFANLLEGNDEAAIAAFSDGGFYTLPYQLLENFSKDKDRLVQSIESLAGKADGGTPLYRAIDNLIPFIASEANNTNKAIVAFTDGEDTEGGVIIEEMIQRACAAGIKIYTVGLSTSVDELELSKIAFRTGGAVMLAEDALQLVSLYSSLGELLQGEGRFYKLQLEVTNPSSDWGPGYLLGGKVNLNLSNDFPIGLPFLANLTHENSGSFNTRIPDCNCKEDFPDDLVKKWKDMAKDSLKKYPDIEDVPNPNAQITCAYADIYKTNPSKFKWAGLAAIVSGKIGQEIANKEWWESILGFFFLGTLEQAVKDGNQAVFEDLYWQHLAFNDGKMEEIEKIYCSGNISIEMYRAWLKISQENENYVWEGNKDLLYHEQKNILQDDMYKPYPHEWSLVQEETDKLRSPVPGHDNIIPSTSKIYDLDDRWKWISENIIPAWRTYEINSGNAISLKNEHKSYCPTCCD